MSVLNISYDQLRREVSRYLGYGRTPPSSGDEATDIADVLLAGQRRFYFPMAEGQRYVWSFLRRVETITTAVGVRSYRLPENFSGMLMGLTYAAGENRRAIARVSEEEIRRLYGVADESGPPRYCAVRAVEAGAGSGGRYELVLFPVPVGEDVLLARWAIEPPALDDSNIYPLGGAAHSETVRQSCLAAAEETLDDTQGVHAKLFVECLAASLQIDREFQ